MTLPGIDISSYQSVTPSLTGLAFAFAKASEGNFADAKYQTHIANIRKAGLTTGAYHFSRASLGTPQAQAAFFLLTAGSVDLYALDVEGSDAFTLAQCQAFIAAMHQAGKRVGMYHSLSGFPHAGQDWDWVAYYNPTPPTISYDFWQYGPRTIGLQKVDGDTFNGDAAALAALVGGPMYTFTLLGGPIGQVTVKSDSPHSYLRLLDGTLHPAPGGWVKHPSWAVKLTKPIPGGAAGADRQTGYLIGDEAAFLLATDVTFTPDPTPAATTLAPGLYEVA